MGKATLEALRNGLEFVKASCEELSRKDAETAELRSKLLHKEASSDSEEKTRLVKVAFSQDKLASVVDGMVKLQFVDSSNKDEVMRRYRENPDNLLDFTLSYLSPLMEDHHDGGRQDDSLTKSASTQHNPANATASQEDHLKMLRSVKVERSA